MSDLYLGDCREVRSVLADNSIDTIITDPPYGLEFMGKGWDKGVPGVEFWREFLAVTKPGGMLLAFGGTRTFHRMTCAIEDAGWEIRDCMMWLYGSGFPKSLDISKAIQKEFECRYLKNVNPAELQYRRFPVELNGAKTDFVVVNAVILHEGGLENPTGIGVEVGFNGQTDTLLFESTEHIDLNMILSWKKELEGLSQKTNKSTTLTLLETITGLKIWNLPQSPRTLKNILSFDGHGTALKPAWEPIILAMKPTDGTFAQNAEKWGAAGINVDGGRIASDIETGWGGKSGFKEWGGGLSKDQESRPVQGRWPANLILDEEAAAMLDGQSGIQASRFFYCSKASKSERNAGCEGLPATFTPTMGNGIGGREHDPQNAKAYQNNFHPTVKPLKLMEYLCTLTKTPTGGIVLDPFAGSGTTLLAAKNTGREYVGIEQNPEYFEIIKARLGLL